MSYTVAHVTPLMIYRFDGKEVLECKCRVEEDGEWQKTVRVRVPFPIYYEDLYHYLCAHLDVGNIEFQNHLEFHVPRFYPESIN
jgi:hypothetical protein